MNFDSQDTSLQVIIIRSVLIGGACLVLLVLLSLKSVIPSIEKEIMAEVSQQFIDKKLNNVLVSASGQDIYLEGLVTTQVRVDALELANTVRGVRKVHDNFIVTDSRTLSDKTQPGRSE